MKKSTLALPRRRLGRTELIIPVIPFGTQGFGNHFGFVEDEEAVESETEVDFEEDPDEYEPANIYDNTQSIDRDIPIVEQVDFVEAHVRQLDVFNLIDWERAIAEEMLGNLVENGYN